MRSYWWPAESITLQSYDSIGPSKRLAGLGEKPGLDITIADYEEDAA